MDDLMGTVVIVRDSTGASTEGRLKGLIEVRGIEFWELEESRQINFVNAEEGNKCEFWEVPGINRIAVHLTAGIHPTHLPARESAKRRR
jgi:hypothetical protein